MTSPNAADPLDRTLTTERLALVPLCSADVGDLHPVLDDPALHEFTGGRPATRDELEARFRRFESRCSPDGTERWLNWVVRSEGRAIGTLQATIRDDEAEVAWVLGTEFQGRGYAREAAVALVEALGGEGLGVVAHVHPDHVASEGVARAAGLSPTTMMVEGERRWVRPLPGSREAAVEQSRGSAAKRRRERA